MKLLKLTDKFEAGKFKGKAISVVINKGESSYLTYFLSRNKDFRLTKEVISLAQSKTQLNFNAKLIEVLIAIDSNVSKTLLKLNDRKRLTSIFTNIRAVVNKKDTVVFDTPFGNKRNEIKIGRLVRKLFELNGVAFTEVDIEKFVTDYFTKIGMDSDVYFKIVKGEDIRKYYLEDNYHERKGTLGNSCVRYARNQPDFDLYVKNKEVEMLVLFNKESEKVVGRSILWRSANIINIVDGESTQCTFMDRIYTANSKHESLFKKYGTDNGFAVKQFQSYNYKPQVELNGKKFNAKILISVTDPYARRPYLDTVAYQEGDKLWNGQYN